jgi:hypothetical protein
VTIITKNLRLSLYTKSCQSTLLTQCLGPKREAAFASIIIPILSSAQFTDRIATSQPGLANSQLSKKKFSFEKIIWINKDQPIIKLTTLLSYCIVSLTIEVIINYGCIADFTENKYLLSYVLGVSPLQQAKVNKK